MFKLLDRCLSGLLRGWKSLSKRASPRVRDQVFLILTLVLVQEVTFVTWAIVLYKFWQLTQ